MTMSAQKLAKPALAAATVAATLLASSYAGSAGTITRDDQYPFYGPGLVNYVASQGQFPAVFVNAPFAVKNLTPQLQLPGYFATAPIVAVAPEARKDGHLVLVFDPAQNYPTGKAACAAPEQFANSRLDPTLRLQAVFCYNSDPVSEAYLETPRPQSAADPGFRQSLNQLMASLLPQRTADGEQCRTAPNC